MCSRMIRRLDFRKINFMTFAVMHHKANERMKLKHEEDLMFFKRIILLTVSFFCSVTDRWLEGIKCRKSFYNPFSSTQERKMENHNCRKKGKQKKLFQESKDTKGNGNCKNELYSILCLVRFNFPVEIGFLI